MGLALRKGGTEQVPPLLSLDITMKLPGHTSLGTEKAALMCQDPHTGSHTSGNLLVIKLSHYAQFIAR